ncbi:ribosome biogenesis GTP-binding protein YihA/YsxC [Thiotrichales bacterium 19S3-7]|nr:ribosome biogenesis GTP-binding protein YihA/YsxC [Thiotrichales bacterium 19S3-7]MCF6802771.1 ribosome biogenesis GTP-binding protein YihA/YsxC [Thiotrichales bacterium 19S3-11]
MNYQRADFLKSVAEVEQLPEDSGYEVAFAGRSNAGKSSALNTLTQKKQLARVSKTPGRTQLINIFPIDDQRRLVDLPGYGYAKVPLKMINQWRILIDNYVSQRACLRGIVLLTDPRHNLKEFDLMMIQWAKTVQKPLHILLTKSDKLTNKERQLALNEAYKAIGEKNDLITVQHFSSLKKTGLDKLTAKLDQWFEA